MNPRPSRITRRGVLLAGAGAAVGITLGLSAADAELRVSRESFGQMPDGQEVDLYILGNASGIEARIMSLGATLTILRAPDRNGTSEPVTLYLDTLADYVRGHPLFGSVVGRYANRIANARFTIDGVQHNLVANARPHHIHGGGAEAFHRALWKSESFREADAVGVRFTHISPDGQAGFPGTVHASATYRLTADNRLIMEYTAQTDKPTHVNLTNHAYWNLAGAGSGEVMDHLLELNADHYLVADAAKIPTGEIRPVKGTVMDFTRPQPIGSRIRQVEGENYDHCYVLNKDPAQPLSLAARVLDPKSGRVMEVHATQPGVQLYTARHVSNKLQGGGKPYGPYHGVCLETQHYPDAPNRPEFPSTLLRPGQTYRQLTVHRFSVQA
jgi:aldose 1-epimerase